MRAGEPARPLPGSRRRPPLPRARTPAQPSLRAAAAPCPASRARAPGERDHHAGGPAPERRVRHEGEPVNARVAGQQGEPDQGPHSLPAGHAALLANRRAAPACNAQQPATWKATRAARGRSRGHHVVRAGAEAAREAERASGRAAGHPENAALLSHPRRAGGRYAGRDDREPRVERRPGAEPLVERARRAVAGQEQRAPGGRREVHAQGPGGANGAIEGFLIVGLLGVQHHQRHRFRARDHPPLVHLAAAGDGRPVDPRRRAALAIRTQPIDVELDRPRLADGRGAIVTRVRRARRRGPPRPRSPPRPARSAVARSARRPAPAATRREWRPSGSRIVQVSPARTSAPGAASAGRPSRASGRTGRSATGRSKQRVVELAAGRRHRARPQLQAQRVRVALDDPRRPGLAHDRRPAGRQLGPARPLPARARRARCPARASDGEANAIATSARATPSPAVAAAGLTTVLDGGHAPERLVDHGGRAVGRDRLRGQDEPVREHRGRERLHVVRAARGRAPRARPGPWRRETASTRLVGWRRAPRASRPGSPRRPRRRSGAPGRRRGR